MGNFRVLAATPEHFKLLAKHGLRFLDYETYRPSTNWKQLGHTLIAQGSCYAGVVGSGDSFRVVAISGVIIQRRGVGQAYLIGSNLLPRYWRGVSRGVKRQIPSIVEFYNLDRLFATTREDFDQGIKFLEYAGFVWEHDEANHTDRQTHSVFVWKE